MQPRQIRETSRPVRPSLVYSMPAPTKIGGRARSLCRLRRSDKDWHIAIKAGEELLQSGDFRQVVERDVGLLWMQRQVVLMIRLGRVEGLIGLDLGDDGCDKDMRCV